MTLRISTIGDTSEDDLNILTVESTTEAEVLFTTEEATSWLLDLGASYHVTPFRSCKSSRAETDRKNRAEMEARRYRERHGETGKGGYTLSVFLEHFLYKS
jgi:hypothetical protein